MHVSDLSSFGQWLRQSRRALDLTQDEFAQRVGCAKGTIRKIEAGELRPSKQLAEVLAKQLGVASDQHEAFVRFARGGALDNTAVFASSPGVLPRPDAPTRRRSNLPIQLTSFVGRAQELAEVDRLISTSRLLTLTGVGGIGKTRLALEAASGLLDSFHDGVWLVEFASLSDSAFVPQMVAKVLNVHEQAGCALLDTMVDFLRAKELLLLLDNCEHLIRPVAMLTASLLQTCPKLKVLATSRESLGILGETPLLVPTMSAPKILMLPTARKLQPEAVQLFVDRATSLMPDFAVNHESAPLIASICMRLDGIPLAIELAAARVRTLSLAQIDSRLDDRFHLLTVGERTAVPRQQSIQATLDWSYALLSESERIVLCRLTVFAGGWTLDAAEFVCADEQIAAGAILDLLSALVDQSLILKEEREGQARFRMLGTIRHYANEKWKDSTDVAAIRQRHLEFFLKLAEDAEQQLSGAEQVGWLNRLELEHDNLRAALEWSRKSPSMNESGLRLAGALGKFWELHGFFSEGRAQLASVLSGQQASEQTAARAKALYEAGHLAYAQGDYPATRAALEESLEVYWALGPASRRGLADALIMLGDMQAEVGDYAAASALMEDALRIMRELKDARGTARALWQLGSCASRQGDYERAVGHFAEALPLTRQLGDKQDTAIILTGLAEVALRHEDYERAISLEEESLKLRRELDEKWGIAASLGNLAWIALRRTDLTQATRLLRESLRLRRELGNRGGIAWCLEKMAELALTKAQLESAPRSSEDWQQAVQLFGAAESVRALFGSTMDLVDRLAHEQQLGVLRAQFGATIFTALWAEAQSMTLEQAVASALGN